MGVNTFEELRVWQAAKAFSDEIGRVIRQPAIYERLVEMTQSVGRMLRVLEAKLRSAAR